MNATRIAIIILALVLVFVAGCSAAPTEVASVAAGPVTVVTTAAPPTRFEITALPDPSATAAARYQGWLHEMHPGAQTLATVTTTTRWI